MDAGGGVDSQNEAGSAEAGQDEGVSVPHRRAVALAAGPFLEQEAVGIVHGQSGNPLPAGAVGAGQGQEENGGAMLILEVVQMVLVDLAHGPLEAVEAQEKAAVFDNRTSLGGLGVKVTHEAKPLGQAVPVDLVFGFFGSGEETPEDAVRSRRQVGLSRQGGRIDDLRVGGQGGHPFVERPRLDQPKGQENRGQRVEIGKLVGDECERVRLGKGDMIEDQVGVLGQERGRAFGLRVRLMMVDDTGDGFAAHVQDDGTRGRLEGRAVFDETECVAELKFIHGF